MAASENPFITMDQLRVGLHVQLDLKWFEHPFAFNKFLIKSEEQIKLLRSLGLARVRYDPARSEVRPPPAAARADEAPAARSPGPHPGLAAKRALVEKIKVQRESAARIESAFVDTARTIRAAASAPA